MNSLFNDFYWFIHSHSLAWQLKPLPFGTECPSICFHWMPVQTSSNSFRLTTFPWYAPCFLVLLFLLSHMPPPYLFYGNSTSFKDLLKCFFSIKSLLTPRGSRDIFFLRLPKYLFFWHLPHVILHILFPHLCNRVWGGKGPDLFAAGSSILSSRVT